MFRIGLRVILMRLVVIGFNKAIVSFQLAQLARNADGLRVPGIGRTVHIVPELQLFIALGLSFLALMAFIMSGRIDKVGNCNQWLMLTGDLLMYLMMAHTVAGFFAPLATTIQTVAGVLPQKASEFRIIQSGAFVVGGAAWFLATYAGPLVSLVRSPFSRRTTIVFGIAYLLLLLVFCWLTAHTVRMEASVSGEGAGLIFGVLMELIQPLRW